MHYSDLILLLQTEGIGRKTILRLKKHLDLQPQNGLEYLDYIEMIQSLIHKKINLSHKEIVHFTTEKILEICYNESIRIITCFDADFPVKFKSIGDDSPVLLFLKGNSDLLKQRNIAVVGTRAPGATGYQKAFQYAQHLAIKGSIVISGLAEGCDTAAHKGALTANKATVVTSPSGIGYIYPKSNQALYKRILDHEGCIISELSPLTPPQKYSFIERDRIQAALAEGLLIIESSLTGGTSHACHYAVKYDKPIAVSQHKTSFQQSMALNQHLLEKEIGFGIAGYEDLDEWMNRLQPEVKDETNC
ncbi:MAG: DNA-protecting protein DprA [Tissierellales bacterium]|nr:DNA-protecting protein DprA [Tissierellales bacterium]MBN2826564.1 DNA-protecting protein DprA [Tissierellales bacterium]